MSNFDNVAASWDKNIMHTERSQAIANKLIPLLEKKQWNRALEFGAGTGLLSFLLKDYFNELVLMDSSQEMVNTASSKIIASNQKHMHALFLDLEHENYTAGKFDIIFTQMVLHHVGNIEIIFDKFNDLLLTNGILAIADLYTEDGSFHGQDFTGHKGFDPETLKQALLKRNFDLVTYQQCYTVTKEVEGGIIKDFPIFLLIAEKKNKI